jgi:hypothetical protein
MPYFSATELAALIAPDPNGENMKSTLSLAIQLLHQLHGAWRGRLVIGVDELHLALDAADIDAAGLIELSQPQLIACPELLALRRKSTGERQRSADGDFVLRRRRQRDQGEQAKTCEDHGDECTVAADIQRHVKFSH